MTQRPPGPPPRPDRYPADPGAGQGPAPYPQGQGGYATGPYAPDQGYGVEPGRVPPPRYRELAQPDPGYVEPQFLPPGSPPQPPRRRRRTPVLAPALALVGLVIIAVASYVGISFLDTALGERAAAEASSEPDAVAVAERTAAPSDALGVATPEPDVEATEDPDEEATLAPPEVISAPPGESADIKGSILFTRAGGDIWQASGRELRNLTSTKSTKSDVGPTWSPDGGSIYFIRRSQRETDKARLEGKYTLHPTDLMRMKADGSGRKTIYQSLTQAGGLWFTHVLQPSVSPNETVAVASDGPDGTGPVILHVVNGKTGRMRKVPVPSQGELGHNDPDFSPDGTRIAYTYNNANGTEGAPRIGIFTCKSKSNCGQGKNKLFKPGFANPSWSPDAKWLAVESTDGTGRNIAIIGARQGEVRVFLTDDGDSFAPEVSPDGDQIAYLRRDGLDIDLRVMTLAFDDRGSPTLLSDQAVTSDGLVDGESSPSWYIPRSQRTNQDVDVDAGDAVATEAPAGGSDASEGAPAPPG